MNDKRLVQVVLRPELCRDGFIDRLVPKKCRNGVAREAEDQEIHKEGGPQEDRNQLEESFQDVCGH